MTLNFPSFFAGIGTVLALLTLGFGGGVLVSGVISDSPREPGKVEKWAAEAQKAPAAAKPVPAPAPPVVSAAPVPAAPPAASATLVPPPAASAISTQSDARTAAEQASVPSAPPGQQQPIPVSSQASSQPSLPSATAAQASPQIGQERPVALVNPAAQPAVAPPGAALGPQPKSERVRRAESRKEKRDAQRRKQLVERRRQLQFDDVPETRATVRRLPPQELDDDDGRRAEFPFFRGRERDDFRRPSFRLFGGDDD